MSNLNIDLEKERKEILAEYRSLLRAAERSKGRKEKQEIRKAFDLALEAHKDMRRKSGEPYIYHPIAVAKIVAKEIGLGTTSIVCALLHDTVEDTEITLEDIESMFGEKSAKIIDGLTKISGVFDKTISLQAENFRKMLLTISDDVRVILIKLADRLHNMRTLESMSPVKQMKIASETLYLYAPLAHRLGLYAIKTELEDLGLKYTKSDIYNQIETNLRKNKAVRIRFINRFILPISRELSKHNFKFEIKGRPKSVYSIWNKMKKQNVTIEEVYDVFAVRIIIDAPPELEKSQCWHAYSIVTDFYKPNPDRLRDWITTPKGNGYESLHTTVMSPTGKWVEVQIRSKRMDEIAEKGYAAHWKYKNSTDGEHILDEWISKIRELLENPESSAIDFLDDFKMNLYSKEIYVFTPDGDLKNLPSNATALDFAFEIHTQIGEKCIGAKVNQKLVPLSHTLKSGDQVEIITSSKQKANEDWLKFVVTAKAKAKIKSLLKEEKRKLALDGQEILERKFRHYKVDFSKANIDKLTAYYKLPGSLDLFYRVAKESIDLHILEEFHKQNGVFKDIEHHEKPAHFEDVIDKFKSKSDSLVIGEDMQKLDYKLSPCCNPISGDDVFGFVSITDGIKIHRTNCPNAVQLMSNYAYRIVKAKWTSQEVIAFLAGIRITGIDEVGIVNKITRIISNEHYVNMRSISFDSNDGIFEGNVKVFVHDTHHLDNLIKNLSKVDGVMKVSRIDDN